MKYKHKTNKQKKEQGGRKLLRMGERSMILESSEISSLYEK